MANIGRPEAVYGSDTAIEQGTRLTWSLHTGEQQVRVFRGPANKVHELYETYKAYAANVPEVDQLAFDAGKGIGELQVIKNNGTTLVGGTSTIVDSTPRWELYVNEERVPIENAEFLDAVATTTAMINTVKDHIARRFAADATNWTSAQLKLFDYLSRGVRDFCAHSYVARVTSIVSTRQAIAAAFDQVGRASGGDNNDPAAPDIENPIFEGIKNLAGIKIDWLCRSPQVRQVEKRRWELAQEWWGIPFVAARTTGWQAGWSASLYPGGHGTP